ncbi:hypothetical protein [Pseudomonas simiae]
MITLDLSTNDAEALLRHCEAYEAQTGDAREDRRLDNALEELAQALKSHLATGNVHIADQQLADGS